MMDQVAHLSSSEDAAAHCALAGDGEGLCRHRWVSIQRANLTTHSTELLLEFCGSDTECAFELLEFRADSDMETQIALCQAHTGPYLEDCVGHAVQAWWLQGLDEETFKAGAVLDLPFPEKMGYFLAASVVCSEPSVGSCDWAHENVEPHCRHHSEAMTRKPETCPSTEKTPMHGANPDHFMDGGVPQAEQMGPLDERRVSGDSLEPTPPDETRPRDPGPPPVAHSGPEDGAGPSEGPPDEGAQDGHPSPDPRTHGHVPNGVPGGGANPAPAHLGN